MFVISVAINELPLYNNNNCDNDGSMVIILSFIVIKYYICNLQ